MLHRSLLPLSAALLVGAASAATAQDVMVVAKPHYKILLENDHVRVVENTLAPGEKDAMHTHPAGWFYVTRGGRMKVVFASGKSEVWTPRTGEAGWSPPEAPHTSENVGKEPMTYVLVEVKDASRGAAGGQPE
ncbi:MAG: cupin domain-containing protein [Gemmatimonadetes bacterium]|nr:cupin domain-containing protein [Gemmatimonadota bacterium]